LTDSPSRTVCYGTDGGELAELNDRVVIGPGHVAQAHTTDEWISLDQLARGADLYARAIARLCGG
jgi:acetylornithine deacetylase